MKKITIFLALAVILLTLVSCGSKYSETEIKAALDELLPKSYEMNEIYFGKGLPISEDKDVLEDFYAGFESDIDMINYHPVAADCPYQNETELRDATLQVYTEEYAEYLFQRAFSGISAQVQNAEGLTETYSAIYAMYIEENGVLTVRLDLEKDALALNRELKTEKMRILSERGNVVTVVIPTYVEGEPDVDAHIRLVKTPDGWRLDSPTY